MRGLFADYMRLMRIPGAVGIGLPPVFGAISVNIFSFSTLIPLFIIGLLSAIFGFVLNDYIDIDLDKLSKDLSMRSLVKETISKKNAMYIFLMCFSITYAIIFVFFYQNNPSFFIGLFCIIMAYILAIIYNTFGKKVIGTDFLLALAESLLFLFGALIVLTDGTPSILTWIIFILVFNQMLYMNAVEGGLKDADHDYLKNVKNIALFTGVKVTQDKRVLIPISFKAFGMGIRCFSAFLIFVPFVFYGISYEIWQIILLMLFTFLFLSASGAMLNIKQFNRIKLRRLIIFQLFVRYSIVPIMLISIIGTIYAFILIIFPFAWYVFFSILIGEKLFEPQL